MRKPFRILVFLFLLVWTTAAHAEIVVADSLEWMIAGSDVVVRGTISQVDRDKGFFIDEVWDKVTIKVAEIFKGEKKKEFHFIMTLTKRSGDPEPPRLAAGKMEYLFFLVKSERHKTKGPQAFADLQWTLPDRRHPMLNLSENDCDLMVTIDLKVLTRTKEVLNAVRAIAKKSPAGPGKIGLIGVPVETEAFKKLWRRSGVLLHIPIDGRLKAQAKKWLNSKDSEHRVQGAMALRYFKSEDNIRLMKNLLQDMLNWTTMTNQGTFRVFPIRRAAFNALAEWGIAVKEPVLEERIK